MARESAALRRRDIPMLIEHVDARAVYDSNGYPALEAVIRLEHGIEERAIAPRGSTVGQYEGVILEDMAAVPALSCVDTAVNMVRHEVRPVLMGLDATEQAAVDAALLALDCTPRKERVGANVCIAVSMAAAKAGARSRELPLYAHLQGGGRASLPAPMFNVFDGAADTHCAVAGIEFLLLPTTQLDTRAALEMAVRVRRAARTALSRTRRYVGDSSQGALVVDLPNCEEGLVLMQEAAIACGYEPRHHFHLGLDLAAADYVERGQYVFPWASDAEADWRLLLQRYLGWQQRYPLRYIEDAYAETDDEPWRALCAASHPSVLIVGD